MYVEPENNMGKNYLVKFELQKTKATLRRRKELQLKIIKLLEKNDDIPIVVIHKMNVSLKMDKNFDNNVGLYFHDDENEENQVNIIVGNFFKRVE